MNLIALMTMTKVTVKDTEGNVITVNDKDYICLIDM